MNRFAPLAASAVLAFAPLSMAQQAAHEAHHAATAATAATGGYTQGEVRKIDKDAGKVTLKHGPIESLDMPGMTMVFRAKDPSALDKVQVGDSVLFKVERIDGALTVTELRKAS